MPLPVSTPGLLLQSQSLSQSCPHASAALVDLFHLPNDLLFKDGQDGVILPHLLEDHATVKLVTHFLKVISEKPETWRQKGKEKKAGEWSQGHHSPQTWVQPFHGPELVVHGEQLPQKQ